MAENITIDPNELIHEVRVDCTLYHVKRFEARLWIAKQIIQFALWITGVDASFRVE